MIIVTTNEIQNKKVKKVIGLVRGSSVRAKWFGKDILAGVRNLLGGEINEYKELLDESRDMAIERMTKEAKKLGANAIIGFRFETSTIAAGTSELLAYGTAVTLK
jgi:uncharacterized protein YbjQ (UPF0145 family)